MVVVVVVGGGAVDRLSESAKKEEFVTKIFFSDVTRSSNNL